MTDLEFWLILAVALPALLLPTAIVVWKGRNVWPVIAMSFVFWPGALGIALRTRQRTKTTPVEPNGDDPLEGSPKPPTDQRFG